MKASEIASIIKAGGKVRVNRGKVEASKLPAGFKAVKEPSLSEKVVKVEADVKPKEIIK